MVNTERVKIIDERNEKTYGQIYKLNKFCDDIGNYLNESIALAKKENYSRGLYLSYVMQAYYVMGTGDYEYSLEILSSLDETIVKNDCSYLCQMLYYGTYSIYYADNKGDLELSLKYANLELEVAEQMDDKDEIMRIQMNLASTTLELGYNETSKDLLNKCIEYFESTNDTVALAYCYVNLGVAHSEIHEHELALEAFRKGLNYSEQHEIKPLIHGTLFSISQVYRERGDFDKALVVLEKAKGLESDYNRIHVIHERVHQSIRLYLSLERYDEALVEMRYIEDQLEHFENNKSLILFYKDQADIYTALGQYKLANKALYAWMDLKENEDRESINREVSNQIHEVYQKEMNRLDALAETGRKLTSLSDFDDMLITLKDSFESVLDADTIGIGLVGEQILTLANYFTDGHKILPRATSLYSNDSVAVWSIQNDQMVVINDMANEGKNYVKGLKTLIDGEEISIKSAMFNPLKIGDEVIGVFTVQSHRLNAYSSTEIKIFSILSDYLAIAVNNAEQRKRLEELAVMDNLTQIHNRKGFMDFYEKKAKHACEMGCMVSISMLDLDYFKDINDTYGHHVGDSVLKKIAKVLKQFEDENTCVARLGGEEFAVMTINMNEQAVYQMAENIRNRMEVTFVKVDEKRVNVTTSIGVVWKEADGGLTYEQLYHEADQALYEAKGKGRNRVEVFNG